MAKYKISVGNQKIELDTPSHIRAGTYRLEGGGGTITVSRVRDMLDFRLHAGQHAEPIIQTLKYLLIHGEKIHAIKQVRAITDWGLKESKEFVDAWMDELEL